MKKSLAGAVFGILTLTVAVSAHAEENAANVHVGNILTSLSGSVDRNLTGGGTGVDVLAPMQYFILDRLAIGGTIGFDYTQEIFSMTDFAVGPALSLYHEFSSAQVPLADIDLKLSFGISAFF